MFTDLQTIKSIKLSRPNSNSKNKPIPISNLNVDNSKNGNKFTNFQKK